MTETPGTEERDCPTCGHPESHHDDGGYCAGCGTCTDPELGRPDGDHDGTAARALSAKEA